MSRLEELLQTLCPNGVELIPLEQVVDYSQPTPYIVKTTLYDDSFSTPVLTAGASFILGYTNEKEGVYTASVDTPVIIFDDFTTSFQWVDFRFKVKSSAIKILTIAEKKPSVLRYIFYAMQCITYQPSQHARQWIQTFSKFQIPLPPLPVQEEIVRILDTFSSTVAELEAERAARIRQYEHYRDFLLTFNETAGQLLTDKQVRWVTLGEIATKISTGGTPNTQNSSFYDGTIPWLRTQEVNWLDIYDTGIKITDEGFNDSSANWIPMNCVIVAMYGATAAKVAINKISLTTNQACCNIQVDETKALYRYVFYWLCKEYETLRAKGQGSQSNINSLIVKNHPIPLPSLEEQSRIVEILDRFDTLVNDLKTGLPAEIALRRKQYEHYRDTLLTFTQTN